MGIGGLGKIGSILASLGIGSAAGIGASSIVSSVFPNKWVAIGTGALAAYSAGRIPGALGFILASGALSNLGLLGGSSTSGGAP